MYIENLYCRFLLILLLQKEYKNAALIVNEGSPLISVFACQFYGTLAKSMVCSPSVWYACRVFGMLVESMVCLSSLFKQKKCLHKSFWAAAQRRRQ